MKPILFNAQMVRAILSGAKTQTRRPVKPQPAVWNYEYTGCPPDVHIAIAAWNHVRGDKYYLTCPYGSPGETLYVRETWAIHPDGLHEGYLYRATDPGWDDNDSGLKWTPSIHMPREASRITLEIKSVRVERIQDISEEDAIAEGCSFEKPSLTATGYYLGGVHPVKGTRKVFPIPLQAFRDLWEQTYPGSWERNEFVWVVGFGRVK